MIFFLELSSKLRSILEFLILIFTVCICFVQVQIDVVEIDEEIVSVATEWFNFTADDQLRISVADGLEYIQQLARSGE